MATKKKTYKKVRKKVAGRSAPKRNIPGWIILLSGVLFGLLVAVFGYVNGWVPKPINPNEKPVAQSTQTNKSSGVEDKSTDLQIEQKNNFDFYEILQDMEVVIDDEELRQTDNRKLSDYTLQLGAFKGLADAEALKAQVAFIGLTANIQSVEIKNTHWHRVKLGPYKGARKAEVVKNNLEKNGFNALIIKQK